jgi:hypothetical protein
MTDTSISKEQILINIEKEGGPYLTTDVVDRADALQAMDCYYNKAIDDAVKAASEYREMKSKYPDDSSEYNYTNLISKLQLLKNICPIP